MNDYVRKESQREEMPIMWGYFCGEPVKEDFTDDDVHN
jgi:hypothetical protein